MCRLLRNVIRLMAVHHTVLHTHTHTQLCITFLGTCGWMCQFVSLAACANFKIWEKADGGGGKSHQCPNHCKTVFYNGRLSHPHQEMITVCQRFTKNHEPQCWKLWKWIVSNSPSRSRRLSPPVSRSDMLRGGHRAAAYTYSPITDTHTHRLSTQDEDVPNCKH